MNKYPWYINHVVSFKFFPDYGLLINIHSPYLSPAKGYFFVPAAKFHFRSEADKLTWPKKL